MGRGRDPHLQCTKRRAAGQQKIMRPGAIGVEVVLSSA